MFGELISQPGYGFHDDAEAGRLTPAPHGLGDEGVPPRMARQLMALDSAGNLYFSDSLNGRLRKISSSGIIVFFR